MRTIKVGEMVWSNFFQNWLKVVEVISDDNWFFQIKGGKVYKAKTPLSHFAGDELNSYTGKEQEL